MTCNAYAEDLPCPPSIAVNESLNQPAPEGWRVEHGISDHFLAGVTFFDGDPKDRMSIAPTHDEQTGRENTSTWDLGSGSTRVWLACRYLDTGIMFSRPLPKTFTTCRVVTGPGSIVRSVSCI
ncbi:STY0301 family protein [Paraburkholderia rhizosphaerae]|nr:STY0301 family protein [Paraburkholderia rhizosphaerae]